VNRRELSRINSTMRARMKKLDGRPNSAEVLFLLLDGVAVLRS